MEDGSSPLPTTHYLLPTTYYLLPTTHYPLPTKAAESAQGRWEWEPAQSYAVAQERVQRVD
jgi:hypothetical protein